MFLAISPLSILNCDGEELAHLSFCPTWPPASIAESVRPELRGRIQHAVDATLQPFAQGVRAGTLANLMELPCVQRLCLRVQFLGGQMLVVAPTGMVPCDRDPVPTKCTKESRRQQVGTSVPGWWADGLNPEVLEWHFAAGLNLTDCSSRSRLGDHNAQCAAAAQFCAQIRLQLTRSPTLGRYPRCRQRRD